ncbi:MAG: APC family permease [Simkaniaceae bacterium]|nr:APC family permease [Simkaniaceae bacterium]
MVKSWSDERCSKMGFLGGASVGIGGMVGGGIFAVLGMAAVLGKGGTPISFAIAGIVAFLTAYGYSKLSVYFQDDGGTIAFLTKGFGNNWVSASLNFLALLSYVVMLGLYSCAFGHYAATFAKPEHQKLIFHLCVCFAIIGPALLNILESKHFGTVLFYIVALKVAILIFFVIIGFIEFQPAMVFGTKWPSFISLAEAGMLIFVANEGFELIANTSEEITNPKKNIPRAFAICLISVTILYILVSLCTVGVLTPAQISASKEFVLAEAARPALGQTGFTIIAIAALLATFSAIKSTLFGTSRITARIASNKQLPKIMAHRFKGRPLVSLFSLTVLGLLFANFVDLRLISILGSAGFLILFTAVNIVNLLLHKKTNSRLWIAIFAPLASTTSLIVLMIHTAKTDLSHLYVLLGLLAVSLIYGVIYCSSRSYGK